MNFFINTPAYYTKEFWVVDEVYDLCKRISHGIDVTLYTDLLNTIAITPIIAPEKYFPEMKKISLPYRFASISLNSDFDSYHNANIELKKQIILENIYSSLRVVKKKLGKSFDYDRMIRDINRLLEVDTEDDTKPLKN